MKDEKKINNENEKFDLKSNSTNPNNFNQINNNPNKNTKNEKFNNIPNNNTDTKLNSTTNNSQNNGNFMKNRLLNMNNETDSNHLNQALNKKNNFFPRNNNNSNEENKESEGLSNKIDKVGEKSVEKFGGKAITAATGGVVSGAVADAVAKKIAKPAGKMLKYILIILGIPIILLLIIIIPVLMGGRGGNNDSYQYNNNDQSIVGGTCTYILNENRGAANNIKVQLLYCGESEKAGTPIDDEELVDFEKYIAGVTYAETDTAGGQNEAVKAQMVMSRTYSLNRNIPNSGQLVNENGQWILKIRNCTEEQVYCDPDKGCYVESDNKNATNLTVHSGKKDGYEQYKTVMSADHPIRLVANDVYGEIIRSTTSSNIVGVSYRSSDEGCKNSNIELGKCYSQTNAINLAKEGNTYDQIIKQELSDLKFQIERPCSSSDSEGLESSNNGYRVRSSRAQRTNEFYYDQATEGGTAGTLEGECAWYATGRAKEILKQIGSPKNWTYNGNGGTYCDSVNYDKNKFEISTDTTKPKVGALISWKNGSYGHVGIVEKVNSDGTIDISEASITNGMWGQNARSMIDKAGQNGLTDISARKKNCEGNNSGCFVYSKNVSVNGNRWGTYRFQCYIYLTKPKSD